MARADGAHVVIGGIPCKLDQAAPEEIQRPAYRHFFRPVFSQRIDITGRPGAQNLREDRLLWHITDWDGGEGQVVLRNNDDASARKFYRSEGLNASIPGQLTLNKAIDRNPILDGTGGATATSEGSAWSAISGSITDTGTDTELNSTTTVAESASFTPGAAQVNMAFHLYKDETTNTIEASALTLTSGTAPVTGSDRTINSFAILKTANLTSGTDFTAGSPVTFTSVATSGTASAVMRVYKTTGDLVASSGVTSPFNSSNSPSVSFTPTGTNAYFAQLEVWGGTSLVLDKMTYGTSGSPTTVTLTVRDHTNTTNIASDTIQISNTSTASVATLTFNAAAATEYRARVTYDSGEQHPFVDKAVTTVLSTSTLQLAMLELGLDGDVIAVQTTATSPNAWQYNFSTDAWDALGSALGDFVNGAVVQAMTHSDTYEYAASTVDVIQFNGSQDHDYIADAAGIAGIAICQNRLWVLTVHATNFVDIATHALDTDASGGTVAQDDTESVITAAMTVDATLKQQMCASPTGVRFFVNLSDVTAILYEASDATGEVVVTELARLPKGYKATCIVDVAGFTFVAAQAFADSAETPRSSLWLIDEDSVPSRVATFRDDDPSSAPICSIQAYGNDLWLLQGKYIWRYSLQTGAVFCEYELAVGEEAAARSIAVTQGRVFALYYREDATNTGGVVWVSNTDATYRQAAAAGGASFTTSVYDYGLPGELKTLRSITAVTDDMPASTSVVVEAQFDQDGTWVNLGTHTTGAETTFALASADAVYEFRTVQLRVTLNSLTGANTPTLKAVVVEALVLGDEEFFEFIILTEDEDPGFHIAGQTRTGGDIVQDIVDLRRSRVPFTMIDAYEHWAPDNNPSYLCVFDTSDGTNDEVGEGRMSVRLRVL